MKTSKKLVLIGDPVAKLKPAADSSFAMAEVALSQGISVYWAEADSVALSAQDVWLKAARVRAVSAQGLDLVEPAEELPLRKFAVAMIRKDPPFDTSYLRLCWLLALEESRVRLLNSPSSLLRYHEKMLPYEAVAQGFLKAADVIPSFCGPGAEARRFLENLGVAEVVSKPFLGHGGEAVHKLSRTEVLGFEPHSPLLGGGNLLQPYQPEITKGDRRVFFLKGKYIGSFLRVPKEGHFVSNLAQGGTAVVAPLSAREKSVIERTGKFLRRVGIFFAGADLIGHRLSEVNVTSPTGFRSLEKLQGPVGRAVVEKVIAAAMETT